jgi:hypothetical protein
MGMEAWEEGFVLMVSKSREEGTGMGGRWQIFVWCVGDGRLILKMV